MPMNEYFNSSGVPGYKSPFSSATIRTEFESIAVGFSKLPTMAGNDLKVIRVAAGGAILEAAALTPASVGLGDVPNVNCQNASNLNAGTVPAARLSLTKAQVGLANVPDVDCTNADNITTGSLALERVEATIPCPAGTIVAWAGGYFTNTVNGGFTSVLGNTVAAANAYLSAKGWRVCDGTAPGVISGSPIFTTTGRYLPNLTDSRFLMGSTSAGTIGGSNWFDHTHSIGGHSHYMDHTHTIDPPNTSVSYLTANVGYTSLGTGEMPYHSHSLDGGVTTGGTSLGSSGARGDKTGTALGVGSGNGHTHAMSHGHTVDIAAFTSAAASTAYTSTQAAFNSAGASAIENRPIFLSMFYIMRVL